MKNNRSKETPQAVHQPHDKIVKKLLTNPQAARDILSLYLPPAIASLVDLNQLELQKDTFIDDEHRAYAVDLLYKTSIQGEEGYIWFLIEHQRKSDHWLPVRIFKYMGIIWDHIRKISKQKHLPLVYPLIIYNGDKAYDKSLKLSDLIEPEASRKLFNNLFSEPFPIVDLAAIKDEDLRHSAKAHMRGIALLMALKHVFDSNLQVFFNQTLLDILKQLEQAGDTNTVMDLVYYLFKEGNCLDAKQFQLTVQQSLSEEVGYKMTSIADRIEQRAMEKGMEKGMERAMEKGMEKGIAKEKLQVARQLLAANINISKKDLFDLIKTTTGLPESKILEIRREHEFS